MQSPKKVVQSAEEALRIWREQQENPKPKKERKKVVNAEPISPIRKKEDKDKEEVKDKEKDKEKENDKEKKKEKKQKDKDKEKEKKQKKEKKEEAPVIEEEAPVVEQEQGTGIDDDDDGDKNAETTEIKEGLDPKEVKAIKKLFRTLLRSDDESEMLETLDGISARLTDHERNEMTFDILVELNCAPYITEAVHKWLDKSEDVVAQGFAAIHNSSLCEDVAIEYIADDNGVAIWELLHEGLQKYPKDENLQTRGCGAISVLSQWNDPKIIKPLITKYNTCDIVQNAIKHHTDDFKLVRWAYRALDIITGLEMSTEHVQEDVEYKKYFLEKKKGLLMQSVNMIEQHDEEQNNNPFSRDIVKFAWSVMVHLAPLYVKATKQVDNV